METRNKEIGLHRIDNIRGQHHQQAMQLMIETRQTIHLQEPGHHQEHIRAMGPLIGTARLTYKVDAHHLAR